MRSAKQFLQSRLLSLELGPQLNELRFSLRRKRTSEVEENLEGGGTCLVKELKATSSHAVHVAWFFHCESSSQLLPADMHVKRESVCTLKNSPAVLKPPNCPSTSIVAAPLDTNTRTDPKASRLRSNSSHRPMSSSMTRSGGNARITSTSGHEDHGPVAESFFGDSSRQQPECDQTIHSAVVGLLSSLSLFPSLLQQVCQTLEQLRVFQLNSIVSPAHWTWTYRSLFHRCRSSAFDSMPNSIS